MTEYRYRALDDQGNPVDGTMESTSARQVTVKLQERGYTVNEVAELHPQTSLLQVAHKLNWDDIQLFTEQLHAITKSELPLAPALKSLAADLRNPRLKPVLDDMQRSLEQGASLEEAVQKNRDAFPSVFPAIIKAGEVSGNLPGVLQVITHYASRMVDLKNSLQTVMAYPIMLMVFAVGIFFFLTTKVLPVFAEIFDEIGGQLPSPTRFWVGIGEHVAQHWNIWVYVFCVIAIGLHLIRRMLERSEGGREWLDWLRLHLPVAGHTYYLISISRFTQTLALLLSSKVPIIESIELAAAASGSAQLQRVSAQAALDVAGGLGLGEALSQTGFFGHHFCWLLSTSEERGDVETALDSLARSYQCEVALRDRAIGILVAPLIIGAVGILFGSMILSLYLPIFSMGDAISG
jgi:type IV pilus assembly protein PilC